MKAFVALAAVLVFVAAASAGPVASDRGPLGDRFDHTKHAFLLSDCTTCHAGVRSGGSPYPDPAFCASCHDGSMQRKVDWTPPPVESRANLRFSHVSHPAFECAQCHQPGGGAVQPAHAETCMACHGISEHQNRAVSKCEMCHVQPPAPPSHKFDWRRQHASEADASPERCATCHVRADCLDCHRPGAASPTGGYHPVDFLQRHPASAYNRETECSTCHNPAQFCQSCHQQAGLVSNGRDLGAGYHDANRNFIAGHGQVARQNLETCVACHSQQDCLRCHTQINPHGPDFDPEKWRNRNDTVCLTCHTGGIPGGM
jgi:hypothetical protein